MRRSLPLLALVLATSPLRPLVGQISLARVTDPASRFVKPVFATSAPGEPTTLYVVGREGVISRLDTTTVGATPEPFMTLNNSDFPGSHLNIISDTGFLGLAFHPDYQSNGKFYTYYSATAGSAEFRVDQFLAVNGVVQTGVRKNVITVPTGPATNFKHAGGWIGFDPTGGTTLHVAVGDGRYVTTAEGGDPENNAQDTSKLLGKLLRIDVGVNGLDFNDPASSYTIPSGNMVVNPNSGLTSPSPPSSDVLPEIYAYGLRNPWRASFDRATGDLYIGDVGQRTREEINFIPAGRINTAELDETPGSLNGINFGWRLREGSIATPGEDSDELRYDYVGPVFDYERTGVSGELPFFGSSITAGYVYRGPEFPDYGGELDGTFLFADLAARQFGSFRIDPVTQQLSDIRNRTDEVLASLPDGEAMPRVASFAEDGFGNLYVIDYSAGDIWKITPVPEPHLAITLLAGLALAGLRGVRRRLAPRR